jgi:raffinose/stachyose/melibiose transport system permease protein
VIAVIAWQNIPFHMILLSAALVGIPLDIYESAWLDGAGKWYAFWSITIPMISRAIKVSCILAVIGSLRYFDLIYVMTQGGPNNATQLMAAYMYRKGFLDYNMGYASSIAAMLFLIIFVFTVLIQRGLDLWSGNE